MKVHVEISLLNIKDQNLNKMEFDKKVVTIKDLLSSTFQKTPQLCCGDESRTLSKVRDEPSHYKIVRGE